MFYIYSREESVHRRVPGEDGAVYHPHSAAAAFHLLRVRGPRPALHRPRLRLHPGAQTILRESCAEKLTDY